MAMTVGELKDILEGYDDELEVRFMSQPNWPFEYSIEGAVSREEMNEDADDEDGEGDEEFEDDEEGKENQNKPKDCLFLVEGQQLGYGSRRAWNHV